MEKILLKRARGELTKRTPIWLMRQAGRYLPEYRSVREKHSFLDVCKTPELAMEVSLQPWRRFQFDGVILFSDILVPMEALGIEMEFNPGPRLKNPLRTSGQIKKLRPFCPEDDVPYVLNAMTMLKKQLNDQSTLIGFCGAPWTLACYLIEGGHSDLFDRVRRMIVEEPLLLHLLLDKLTEAMICYLGAQLAAGAEVIQIFDSLTTHLSHQHYLEFAYPYEKRMVDAMSAKAPTILFAKDTARFLADVQTMECSILSCDSSMPLEEVRKKVGSKTVIQGNLDPNILEKGTKDEIQKATRSILREMVGHPHIFNLGHGIKPNTPVENVVWMVETVRNFEGDSSRYALRMTK